MLDSSPVGLDLKDQSVTRARQRLSGNLCCLFSSAKTIRMGNGRLSRRHVSKIDWFVRQVAEGRYGVRSVNGDSLPGGDEVLISRQELVENYTPELARFEERVVPAALKAGYHKTQRGEREPLLNPEIMVSEGNVRALFDLGLDYFAVGQFNCGRRLVNHLLQIRVPFFGKDQFLYNDFGILLRKIGMFDGAVQCYRRALDYTSCDDHLYYNLARAHYERGHWWDCIEALGKCFEYNPELGVSRGLVELIVAMGKNPALQARYNKPPVPDGVARRAGLLAEAVTFVRPTEPILHIEPTHLEGQRAWTARENNPDNGLMEREEVDEIINGLAGV